MPMIPLQSIAGKYFISSLGLASGAGGAVLHGRILGPLMHDWSNYYLCEIYPNDVSALEVAATMVWSVEQLSGVYLYDDREIMQVEWEQLMASVTAAKEAAAVRKAQRTMTGRRVEAQE